MQTIRLSVIVGLIFIICSGLLWEWNSRQVSNPQAASSLLPPANDGRASPFSFSPSVSNPVATSSQAQSSDGASYVYNSNGQLALIRYPDGSVYTYSYDANGDKIREIERTGKTWCYTYDQQHHPVTIVDPEGRVTHLGPTSVAP